MSRATPTPSTPIGARLRAEFAESAKVALFLDCYRADFGDRQRSDFAQLLVALGIEIDERAEL